jgi:hypothetical protein
MRWVLRIFGVACADQNHEIAPPCINAAKIICRLTKRERKRRPQRPGRSPFAFGVKSGRWLYEVFQKHFAASSVSNLADAYREGNDFFVGSLVALSLTPSHFAQRARP